MSTHPPAAPSPIPPVPVAPGDREVRVFSHSTLFYWWPVWVVGLILGIMSGFSDHRLVIVPKGTDTVLLPAKDETRSKDQGFFYKKKDKDGSLQNAQIEESPREAQLYPHGDTASIPRHYISSDKNFGVVFFTILLLVIVVTNVPMRGMWSLVVIITLFLLSIIFALAGTWEWIFAKLEGMDIYINMAGYIYVSLVLFILWLVSVLVFDRQMYMVFTPGQFRVCQSIGGGEHVFSTDGMTLEKQRSDLFRHWIIGLGSGDMTVKTSRGDHFDLHNVLFVGRKVAMIEDMMREKAVVRSR